MATFVDLGNMRAKLDTRTGQIRITSGEKDSPLKKEGFVLNVYRGSKEYVALTRILENSEKSIPVESRDFITGSSLQSSLESIALAEHHYEKGYYLAGLLKWEKLASKEENLLVRTIESLLYVDNYLNGLYYHGHLKGEQNQDWLDRLIESTRNHGAAMSRVDHVRANLDDPEWIERLTNFVDNTYRDNEEQEKNHGDSAVRNRYIKLAHKVALYANGGWKEGISHQLPKVVHLSKKHHSSVPELVPLGVDASGEKVKWNLRNDPHMRIVGKPGTGKTMMLSSIVHHVSNHKKDTRVIATSADLDFSLPQTDLLEENLDIYSNPTEAVKKVWSIVESRFQYMQENSIDSFEEELRNGKAKRLFLIVDDFMGWQSIQVERLSHDKESNETLIGGMIDQILRTGRSVGVHVVLSSQKEPGSPDLRGESKSNIPLVVDLTGNGEGSFRDRNAPSFRGFMIERNK